MNDLHKGNFGIQEKLKYFKASILRMKRDSDIQVNRKAKFFQVDGINIINCVKTRVVSRSLWVKT